MKAVCTVLVVVLLTGMTCVSAAEATTITFDSLTGTACTPACTPDAGSVLTDDLKGDGVVFGHAGVSAGVAGFNVTSVSSAPNAVVGLDAGGDVPDFFVADIYFNFVLPGTSTPAVTDSVSFNI